MHKWIVTQTVAWYAYTYTCMSIARTNLTQVAKCLLVVEIFDSFSVFQSFVDL